VGAQWYGVDVDTVIEVLHFVALTELPGASSDVLGLLTLRDRVMNVVDLRLRFAVPDAALSLQTPIVALETGKGPLGIVADEVDDVVDLPELADYEGTGAPYIAGAATLADQLLLLLDTERLVTVNPCGKTLA
jgi:purine-binding chemotaxis protein CheW